MSLPDEPLDETVRDELQRHYGAQTPPPELEERVVAALRAEGLLRRRSAPPGAGRRSLAAAAALVLFVLGYAVGALAPFPGGPPDTAEGALFLLLLREPTGAPLTAAGGEGTLVAEYSAWAGEQAREGRLVLGEKLASTRALVADGTTAPALDGSTEVTGLFLVRAPDLATARAIARSCPHVRHGGTIEVRPVEPT